MDIIFQIIFLLYLDKRTPLYQNPVDILTLLALPRTGLSLITRNRLRSPNQILLIFPLRFRSALPITKLLIRERGSADLHGIQFHRLDVNELTLLVVHGCDWDVEAFRVSDLLWAAWARLLCGSVL